MKIKVYRRISCTITAWTQCRIKDWEREIQSKIWMVYQAKMRSKTINAVIWTFKQNSCLLHHTKQELWVWMILKQSGIRGMDIRYSTARLMLTTEMAIKVKSYNRRHCRNTHAGLPPSGQSQLNTPMHSCFLSKIKTEVSNKCEIWAGLLGAKTIK